MSVPVEIEVRRGAVDAGPRVRAPFGRRRCAVESNAPVGAYRLVGVADPRGPEPHPGQFYMLAAADGWGGGHDHRPYLARAFSVCRVRGSGLEFLVDDIGPGTHRLAALRRGEELFLVGPLGVGFSLPAPGGALGAVLVGGGAGVAPLVVLAEALLGVGTTARALLGFRSAAHSAAAGLFPGDASVATDDGTLGHRGRVTELLERTIDGRPARVYACGPPAMLEEVRRICHRASLPAQLALEEPMACGFGACFGCVVRTRSGYRRICVDGPVIEAGELDEGWLYG